MYTWPAHQGNKCYNQPLPDTTTLTCFHPGSQAANKKIKITCTEKDTGKVHRYINKNRNNTINNNKNKTPYPGQCSACQVSVRRVSNRVVFLSSWKVDFLEIQGSHETLNMTHCCLHYPTVYKGVKMSTTVNNYRSILFNNEAVILTQKYHMLILYLHWPKIDRIILFLVWKIRWKIITDILEFQYFG